MSGRAPTEREAQEARALAEALAGGAPLEEAAEEVWTLGEASRAYDAGGPGALEDAREGPPAQDALEVAALLRHAAGAARLAPEREDAVWERVRGAAAPRAARRWRGLAWGLAPAAALAAAALVLVTRAPEPTRLPPPDAALLGAQARAATEPEALAELSRRMGSYRGQVQEALAARYGRRP